MNPAEERPPSPKRDLHADRAQTSALRASDLSLIGWLWRTYLRPQWPWLLLAVLFMAIQGAMLGAISYIVQPMFDQVFVAGDRDAVYWIAAAVAVIFVVRATAGFAQRLLTQGVGLRIITAMQRDISF